MPSVRHSDTDVPPNPNRLELTLKLDGESGLVSLSVNGIPVATTAGGEAGTGGPPDHTQAAVTHLQEPPRGLGERWHDFRRDGVAYGQFLRLGASALATLIIAALIQVALYRYPFAAQPDFLDRYGWWMLYLDINVVALVTLLVYLRAYHLAAVSHMLGMMMGMTVGMQVGTMIGAVLGATNGFFTGAMVGMGFGAFAGIYIGCRCGTTMAVIQGLMSGVMAGTMGAMLIVMMLRDRVLTFMPVFTLANLLIVMGFAYLFHEEAIETRTCRRKGSPGVLSQAILSLLIIAALCLVMWYGPKGPMIWTGETVQANPATGMRDMPGMRGM